MKAIIRFVIRFLLIYPYKLINKTYLYIFHLSLFKLRNVGYDEFPSITGKLLISNLGRCHFEKGVRFNSSTQSNLVGLNKGCTIYVAPGATLKIGKNSGFSGVSLYCSSGIEIGQYVNCGGNVSIWDTDFHPLDFESRRIHDVTTVSCKPIKIGNDVLIGANAIILKGVTIGDRSIIGAGSVVSKNIPADEIWAGNPVRFIRKIVHD